MNDATGTFGVSVDEALEWVGAKLAEVGGASVGRVEDVYVDAEDGSTTWVLVKVGRFGRYSAVPFDHVAGAAGRVWVPYSRDELRGAPTLEPGRPLSREQELELCEHFGLPRSGGRAEALASRPEGAETSRPAPEPEDSGK
jgi:sporulation protein YlmC with PRC-barrel domain